MKYAGIRREPHPEGTRPRFIDGRTGDRDKLLARSTSLLLLFAVAGGHTPIALHVSRLLSSRALLINILIAASLRARGWLHELLGITVIRVPGVACCSRNGRHGSDVALRCLRAISAEQKAERRTDPWIMTPAR